MSEFRFDPLFGNLTIVAGERAARPHRQKAREAPAAPGPCPLCPGNESLCPPEISRYPAQTASSKWQTRAFANRYPALHLEAEPLLTDVDSRRLDGGLASFPGFGVHEVVVDSPSHSLPFWALDAQEASRPLELMQSRIRDLYKDRRILYIQAFKNHRGSSGASLDHPHFQLLGLAFVPPTVKTLVMAASCRVCSLLQSELKRPSESSRKGSERLLTETSRFVALADYAPTFGYQFSIYPKAHEASFELASKETIEDLAQICTLVMGKMNRILGEFPVNVVWYSQPNTAGFNRPTQLPAQTTAHWFLRFYPRMGRHAGFELSTGVGIVQDVPEDIARAFREKAL